jgi:hypothetical protein
MPPKNYKRKQPKITWEELAKLLKEVEKEYKK